jgi:hypothetical protein
VIEAGHTTLGFSAEFVARQDVVTITNRLTRTGRARPSSAKRPKLRSQTSKKRLEDHMQSGGIGQSVTHFLEQTGSLYNSGYLSCFVTTKGLQFTTISDEYVHKLRGFYNQEHISVLSFNCEYSGACEQDAKPSVLVHGTEGYVGFRYGEAMKVVFMSLDIGCGTPDEQRHA